MASSRSVPMSRLASTLFASCLAMIGGAAFGQIDSAIDGRADNHAEPALALYVNEVTSAARLFLEALTEEQRNKVMAPFDSPERVTGRDTRHTPAFCAVLAWCVGWGLPHCSLTYPQQRALTRLLATALSDSGYQTVRAILNSHRLIGELERVADADFVGEVAKQCETLEADSVFDLPAQCLPDGKPAPGYAALGGAAPTDSAGNYTIVWRWPNGPPGFKVRHEQFCDHNIAFFGTPGSDRWAFRFEGHHLTVNITFERDAATGHYRVAATPLFLGSFPMIAPPSPAPDDTGLQLTWTSSQELMRDTVDHVRRFVAALPAASRQSAFVAGDRFPQAAPLRLDQFPNWLLSSTQVDPTAPLPTAPTTFSTTDLDDIAAWHLRLVFRRYFDTLHPVIGDRYGATLDRLLAEGTPLSILWAGAPPEVPGGPIFLHVTVGSLLLEINADNEWSTQHRAVPRANHLHSMFRDLSFRWDYDASLRQDADHHHKPEESDPHDAE